MSSPQFTIALAGETYSSNVGDGIIADTLCYLLKKASPEWQVVTLDISGRQKQATQAHPPNATSVKRRWLTNGVFPRPWENLIKWRLHRERQCVKRWAPLLSQADILVIGGGQLLMDNGLDFPLKINRLVLEASSHKLPVHFSACGVGASWSPKAARLQVSALETAETVSVRDNNSLVRLQQFAPGVMVTKTADPAVWAKEVYGSEAPSRNSGRIAGLGIMSPEFMNRYRLPNEKLTAESLIKFWRELTRFLQKAGFSVEFFTNGAAKDNAFASRLKAEIEQALGPVSLAPFPSFPRDLARTISTYYSVVASRLHANIISYAYSIPSVGLNWDDKVRAFYEDTSRPEFCHQLDPAHAEKIGFSLLEANRIGIDEVMRESSKQMALANAHLIRKSIEVG